MKTNRILVVAALSLISRDDLRATAKSLGLPTGKNKENTVATLADAITESKVARCTVDFTIRKGASAAEGCAVAAYKFRSARAGAVLIAPPVAS